MDVLGESEGAGSQELAFYATFCRLTLSAGHVHGVEEHDQVSLSFPSRFISIFCPAASASTQHATSHLGLPDFHPHVCCLSSLQVYCNQKL